MRFIDAYIDKLDLKELGFKVRETNIGRPAYSEKLLLKIYIYGYMNRVRSSRRLEIECKRNIELIWLTGRLTPDFKTIADFRHDNKEGLKRVYKEFLKLCYKLKLLSFEIIGIDGTKIRGQNSNDNIYKRDEIGWRLEKVEEKIENYLTELDRNDKEERGEYEELGEKIREKVEKLESKREKIKKIKEIFEEEPEMDRYLPNDPESNFMKDKGMIRPGYNIQTVVDEKEKLIVDVKVSNENNDHKQILDMCERVEEVKKEIGVKEEGIETIKVADAGYYNEKELLEARERGHKVYVPHPLDVNREMVRKKIKERRDGIIPEEGYRQEDFRYEKERDVYICPEGKECKRINKEPWKSRGKEVNRYICKSCGSCDKRWKCTKGRYRSLCIYARKEEIEEYNKEVPSEEGKRIIRKRKELCEHPFGTIKRHLGYNYILMKGKGGCESEFSLIALVYNMKRVLNIFKINQLLEAI